MLAEAEAIGPIGGLSLGGGFEANISGSRDSDYDATDLGNVSLA
jgi:hypothetical protein